jgi:hypothetical protein
MNSLDSLRVVGFDLATLTQGDISNRHRRSDPGARVRPATVRNTIKPSTMPYRRFTVGGEYRHLGAVNSASLW